MKTQKFASLTILCLSVLLSVGSCAKRDSFPASNAFYINDQADALLSSTQYLIYRTSLDLYQDSTQNSAAKAEGINGAQVVVATALAPVDSLSSTDIFNAWGIGDNDMGLFLLLYFEPNEEDEYFPTYLGMSLEMGDRLSGYIAMSRLGTIYDETWSTSGLFANDYDTKLANFYLAVIEEIHEKVYLDSTFSLDQKLAWYEENQYESFINYIPSGTVNANKLPWWAITLIILGVLLLAGSSPLLSLLLTGKGGTSHSGGGGSSRGYRIRR